MARMVPRLTAPELALLKSAAERRFYECCERRLPNEWLVLFSTPWIFTTPTGRRYDGEADFIIFAPPWGFLVVEVKGGGIAYESGEGRWYTINRHSERVPIKDPFRQAVAEKHALLQILAADKRWVQCHGNRVLSGHAVFFADVDRLEGLVSPGSPQEILGGRRDLDNLAKWVEQVLQFWSGIGVQTKPLSAGSVSLVEHLFHGRLEARPLVSAQLRAEEEVRIQLTHQQSRILRGIGARRRAAICGGAGTGKTLLAMERARQLAESGQTLLLCYNRLLADYFKHACRGAERLSAMTFHQLCEWKVAEAKAASGRDLVDESRRANPQVGPQHVFEFHLPYALALSGEASSDRFDAIIIDEGQDFRDDYWLGIEWLLRDDNSCLYVFYDQNQALYTRGSSFPIPDEPFVLTFNCRNTRHIHDSAYRFFTGDSTDAPPGNEGRPIAEITAATTEDQAKALHAAIAKLLKDEGVGPEQIAVLVCGQPKAAYYQALTSRLLPRSARWTIEGAASDRGVRVDTVRRFKGLEADVVFLWGLDSVPAAAEPELLYVGISRAKSLLTIVGSSEVCRRTLHHAAVRPPVDNVGCLLETRRD